MLKDEMRLAKPRRGIRVRPKTNVDFKGKPHDGVNKKRTQLIFFITNVRNRAELM